jgi:hypothetical protein
MYRSFSGNSFQSSQKKKDPMVVFSKLLPALHVGLCRHCPMSSRTELSAVVFGQYVHLILILVIFFFWGCLKDNVYNSNPRTKEELKENIRKELANIPAEPLKRVNQNIFHRCNGCLRVEGHHFQHLL